MQALKTDAEYYLQTSKLPPVVRGNSPVALVQQRYQNAMKNYGNALAQSRGMSPQEVKEKHDKIVEFSGVGDFINLPMRAYSTGMGSRLRSKSSPKPLVRLGGISLVERALAGAREAGFDEVVVVTGHRADLIDRHVLDVSRRRGIAVTVVRNGRYREGNGLSALAARERVGCDPFALVMADHVFSPCRRSAPDPAPHGPATDMSSAPPRMPSAGDPTPPSKALASEFDSEFSALSMILSSTLLSAVRIAWSRRSLAHRSADIAVTITSAR